MMQPNPNARNNECPPDALGKRITVRLRNGELGRNWAADGKGGCRWSQLGYDHDIVEYEVAS